MKTQSSWFNRVVAMTIVMLSVGVFAALSYADDDPVPQQITCPDCGGEPVHMCYTCWGSGRVLGVEYDDQALICYACSGNCGVWEGVGCLYTCPHCGGSGCGYCYGQGIVSDSGYEWHPCTLCDETGHLPDFIVVEEDCSDCEGSGQKTCGTCDGCGYIITYE